MFALSAFTLALRVSTNFRTALKWYFACESQGYNPASPCDRSQLEGLRNPGISLIGYILLELFPLVNFIYVINVKETKKWICRWICRRKDQEEVMEDGRTRNLSHSNGSQYYTSQKKLVVNGQSRMTPDTAA